MGTYNTYSDLELLALLRKSDQKAYVEIYERYKTLLYIFAYKKTNDREEAKDLLHELFLILWEKREHLVIASELPAYLFFVLKNKIFDLYKHKKVSRRYIESFQDYLDNVQGATDHLVRHNELSALIEREIAALPERMRQVFELSRKTNLNRKEIAEELGLSEQTVKSHMQHALKILKVRLGSMLILIFFIHH